MNNLPILVIGFNKPHCLRDLLTFLVRNTNSKVYIHLDGSSQNGKYFDLNQECQRIVKHFSRDNENIISHYSNTNLGGQYGVLSAIDWFFSNEECGLILEEDITISPSAFDFISVNSNFLRDKEYFGICLFNPIPNMETNFTLNHWVPWGWATTKSKWHLFRKEIIDNSFRLQSRSQTNRRISFPVRYFLNSIISKVDKGEISTWDAQLHSWLLTYSYKCIFPAKTLSRHLGHVPQATHADLVDWWQHLHLDSHFSSILIDSNIEYRNLQFEKLWRMTWWALVSNTLRKIVR